MAESTSIHVGDSTRTEANFQSHKLGDTDRSLTRLSTKEILKPASANTGKCMRLFTYNKHIFTSIKMARVQNWLSLYTETCTMLGSPAELTGAQ